MDNREGFEEWWQSGDSRWKLRTIKHKEPLFETWQAQQKKIEALQKRNDDLSQACTEKQEALDGNKHLAKEYLDMQKRNGELEAFLKELVIIKGSSDPNRKNCFIAPLSPSAVIRKVQALTQDK